MCGLKLLSSGCTLMRSSGFEGMCDKPYVKRTFAQLAGENRAVKTIATVTGLSLEDVKFFMTLPKKQSRKGKFKVSDYPRLKYDSWVVWKAYQLRGSVANRSKKYGLATPGVGYFKDRVRYGPDDGKNWVCGYTGEEISRDDIELDHATPLTRGGDNSAENLVFTSRRINRIKGEMTGDEFTALIRFCKANLDDGGKDLFKRLYASTNMFGGSWK